MILKYNILNIFYKVDINHFCAINKRKLQRKAQLKSKCAQYHIELITQLRELTVARRGELLSQEFQNVEGQTGY